MLLPEWSTAVSVFSDSCSWVPCLSWTGKLPAVLSKILQLPQILWFSAFLCIWTLSNNDCMILSSIFVLQKENPCIKPGREYFLFWSGYIWLNLSYGKHASSFWRAAINEKNMIFRQNKKNIHIFMFKCFHALALNVWFFPSGASVSVWIFCNSCKRVPQLSSVWKDGSQNHTVIVGKGSNTQKRCKTKNLWDLKDFSKEQQTV